MRPGAFAFAGDADPLAPTASDDDDDDARRPPELRLTCSPAAPPTFAFAAAILPGLTSLSLPPASGGDGGGAGSALPSGCPAVASPDAGCDALPPPPRLQVRPAPLGGSMPPHRLQRPARSCRSRGCRLLLPITRLWRRLILRLCRRAIPRRAIGGLLIRRRLLFPRACPPPAQAEQSRLASSRMRWLTFLSRALSTLRTWGHLGFYLHVSGGGRGSTGSFVHGSAARSSCGCRCWADASSAVGAEASAVAFAGRRRHLHGCRHLILG